jgi:rare lipoprotein A
MQPIEPWVAPARWWGETKGAESVPRFSPVLFLLLALAACAAPPRPAPPPEQASFSQEGIASWYGKTHQGRLTASGERFDTHKLTAAHRSLPLGTVVRVTNLDNGRMLKLRVNDRGPYIKGRILDLSDAAATALGLKEDGTAPVRIEVYASDQPLAGVASGR